MILLTLARSLRPDPGPARDLLRAELAKREYQPTLLERVAGWVNDLLHKLTSAADGIGSLSPAVAVVLVVVLLVGLAVVLARLRRDPRPKQPSSGPVFADTRISAAEHRARADRARAENRYDDVVVEAMRALAVGLVERAITDDLPAATAREVADQAAATFTGLADRLRAAAEVFDTVRYGDRHAGPAAADELLDLETTLRRTRPGTRSGTGPVLAVPR